MIAPIVGLFFIIFSGYLITRDAIDPWFIWLYYLSPFSWSVRAFALIEFHSDKYNEVCADSAAVTLPVRDHPSMLLELQAPSIGGQRAGDFYLSQFEQQTDDEWIWAGIVFNLVFLCVTTVIAAVRLC